MIIISLVKKQTNKQLPLPQIMLFEVTVKGTIIFRQNGSAVEVLRGCILAIVEIQNILKYILKVLNKIIYN